MNYGELKTQFIGLLKRRDMTDAQADTFIADAVTRIQRVLRIPPMEKSIAVTYDGDTFNNGELPIPSDYLRLIAITATTPSGEEYEVKQKDLTTVLRDRQGGATGCPRSFTRRGGLWHFGPVPPVGTTFRIDYYDEFPAFSGAASSNYLSAGASDLVRYGALSFAGDWFVDKRAPVWEGRFQSIIKEIQDQADADALMNAQASAAFEYPEF